MFIISVDSREGLVAYCSIYFPFDVTVIRSIFWLLGVLMCSHVFCHVPCRSLLLTYSALDFPVVVVWLFDFFGAGFSLSDALLSFFGFSLYATFGVRGHLIFFGYLHVACRYLFPF